MPVLRLTYRQLFLAAGAVFLIGCALGTWYLQPSRTLERSFSGLLRDVEKRKWNAVSKRISPDYQDRWGLDREAAIALGSDGLRQFFVFQIEPVSPRFSLQDNRSATVETGLVFSGTGSALASVFLNRANDLQRDFTFTFVRASWKPWDWQLVSMDQPEVNLRQHW